LTVPRGGVRRRAGCFQKPWGERVFGPRLAEEERGWRGAWGGMLGAEGAGRGGERGCSHGNRSTVRPNTHCLRGECCEAAGGCSDRLFTCDGLLLMQGMCQCRRGGERRRVERGAEREKGRWDWRKAGIGGEGAGERDWRKKGGRGESGRREARAAAQFMISGVECA
jgi:hypothetical protein